MLVLQASPQVLAAMSLSVVPGRQPQSAWVLHVLVQKPRVSQRAPSTHLMPPAQSSPIADPGSSSSPHAGKTLSPASSRASACHRVFMCTSLIPMLPAFPPSARADSQRDKVRTLLDLVVRACA